MISVFPAISQMYEKNPDFRSLPGSKNIVWEVFARTGVLHSPSASSVPVGVSCSRWESSFSVGGFRRYSLFASVFLVLHRNPSFSVGVSGSLWNPSFPVSVGIFCFRRKPSSPPVFPVPAGPRFYRNSCSRRVRPARYGGILSLCTAFAIIREPSCEMGLNLHAFLHSLAPKGN